MNPKRPAVQDRLVIQMNMAIQYMFIVLSEKRAKQALNRVKRRLHGE